MNPAQRQARKEKAEDFRYLQTLRNPLALIDGWKCPVCKKRFTNPNGCDHSWKDVKEANDKFLLHKMKDGRMEIQ